MPQPQEERGRGGGEGGVWAMEKGGCGGVKGRDAEEKSIGRA